MRRPVIGITGNERAFHDDEAVYLSYTPKGFVEGVQAAGGVPLMLPIGDEAMAEQYVSMIDKLILTGGQNVLPQFYQAEKEIESDDYLLARDVFELALIQEALRQKKPIFTVCRGTQLYNVAMGGTLYQDIEDHWQDMKGQYTSQELATVEGSVLRNLYGERAQINSFHHQSIKDLASNLQVIAYDPKDQIIEAVTTTDGTPYLGVQWHPELLRGNHRADQALFDYVVNEL